MEDRIIINSVEGTGDPLPKSTNTDNKKSSSSQNTFEVKSSSANVNIGPGYKQSRILSMLDPDIPHNEQLHVKPEYHSSEYTKSKITETSALSEYSKSEVNDPYYNTLNYNTSNVEVKDVNFFTLDSNVTAHQITEVSYTKNNVDRKNVNSSNYSHESFYNRSSVPESENYIKDFKSGKTIIEEAVKRKDLIENLSYKDSFKPIADTRESFFATADAMNNMFDVFFIVQDDSMRGFKYLKPDFKKDIKSYDVLSRMFSPMVFSSKIKKISIPALSKNSADKTIYNQAVSKPDFTVSGEKKVSLDLVMDTGFWYSDFFNNLAGVREHITDYDKATSAMIDSKYLLSSIPNVYRYTMKRSASNPTSFKKLDICIQMTPHGIQYNDYRNIFDNILFYFTDVRFLGSAADIPFAKDNESIFTNQYEFVYKDLSIFKIPGNRSLYQKLQDFAKESKDEAGYGTNQYLHDQLLYLSKCVNF